MKSSILTCSSALTKIPCSAQKYAAGQTRCLHCRPAYTQVLSSLTFPLFIELIHVTLENIGNRSAYDAFLYVYNADAKNFMKAPTYKTYVKPGKTTAIIFFDEKINYITENDLIENIKEQYNINIDSVDNYIKLKDTNWLFLFYKDIQGKVYLRTRGFVRNNEGYVIHGHTDFVELN